MNRLAGAFLFLSCVLATPVAWAEETPAGEEPANPLEQFERLIGSRWQLDNSYQVFEWGVGKLSVVSRAYVQTEAGDRLVSQGAWFYHPGEDTIRGYFTAEDMGVRLFEYDTSFEGDEMVSKLVTWDNEGNRAVWEERWRFTDDNHYIWELFEITNGHRKNTMRGVFVRVDR